MNKICLTGNLCHDPSMKTFTSSKKCRFIVAVNSLKTQADGTRPADFIPVSTWNGLAETCMEYLQKGSKVAVTGRLATRRHETDDGKKRTVFEVVAESVEFIGRTKKHSNREAAIAQPDYDEDGEDTNLFNVFEDDIIL